MASGNRHIIHPDPDDARLTGRVSGIGHNDERVVFDAEPAAFQDMP